MESESKFFFVVLLIFTEGCSALMFVESMVENIYDSVGNMNATISVKNDCHYLSSLPSRTSYMTNHSRKS